MSSETRKFSILSISTIEKIRSRFTRRSSASSEDGSATSNFSPKRISDIFTWNRLDAESLEKYIKWIQLGISHVLLKIGPLDREPLYQDFNEVVSYNLVNVDDEFKFIVYSPNAFQYVRNMLGIRNDDFRYSICSHPLGPLVKKGKSGSTFYITRDERYVIKTIRKKESNAILSLLLRYVVSLGSRKKDTLLPKFVGLYASRRQGRKVRLIVMTNIMPKKIVDFQYDLKGSSHQRNTETPEGECQTRAYKDLDFVKHYPYGFYLDYYTYKWVTNSISEDCLLLESFDLMDYSLLIGIQETSTDKNTHKYPHPTESTGPLWKVFNKIYARNDRGEEVVIYLGIIDILQSYTLKKRCEQCLKSKYVDAQHISVARPDIYSRRFQNFLMQSVFKLIPYTQYFGYDDKGCGCIACRPGGRVHRKRTSIQIVRFKMASGEIGYRADSLSSEEDNTKGDDLSEVKESD